MDQDLSLIWEKCLLFMRDNLNAAEDNDDLKKLEKSFDLLFDKVQPLSLVNHNLTLLVPSDFYKEYIEDNYLSLLSAALRKNIGKGVKLWYSVMENKPAGKEKPITQKVKGISTPAPKIQEAMPKAKNLVNPLVAPGIRKVNIESNLIPHLSFDNFVEGESNKFASTVAKSIAKRPGATAFNPLFIHGGVGVGKTHLAHAIGLEVKNNFPEKVVLYLSSEKFIQQFVSAAKAQNKTDFQNYYQMVDVLVIDDIQFLSGKAATQDSFFHIFDYLHQNGKQIVLTSDKAPVDIQDIQERIVSRFKWGLSAEVKSPDFDTRRKIIVDKLSRDGIVLTDDMVDYLAGEVKSNVRELIGVINSVIAYSTIYKSELSLELLKDTINKIASTQKKVINIPYIQEVVCEYFGLNREQLLSKSRKRDIALPRQLAMYFSKELTNATFSKIGEEMGGKDHSTVMYAVETIKDVSKIDKEIKKYVKDLSERMKQ
ncbi:chromosomal replication initiator protein DnaA [Chryseobacterium taklimakanense]|uniref:Chromosomal replication initiator protein DnaA n=2 Tax=Chryseobacterium taklimakanense TaxID=536441 RepID=A0A3G8WWN3_9FLAO|nr:chromosomal replication initiator protein DnaA [Chryseobacterium taklimakanense]AZI20542.1 chromosomal replication initiator protein DnaA [Chryseobacterium taklimakanense]AZI22604.1 chromosomal replication initiator protein DnaA [Chryseobacterium taklimakanense]MCG7281361.1 chromosomal replication initiator protein DnaA [Chryseobacterium taklimakanense]